MNLKTFILLNIVLIIGSVYIVWYIRNKNEKEYVSLSKIINRENLTLRAILIGSIFGFVFGFIDNLFLVIGLNNLEHFFPGDLLTKSGLGNTYSDVIASFIGTFIAHFMTIYTNSQEDEFPLWANSFGMFIGCLVGLYAGKGIARLT